MIQTMPMRYGNYASWVVNEAKLNYLEIEMISHWKDCRDKLCWVVLKANRKQVKTVESLADFDQQNDHPETSHKPIISKDRTLQLRNSILDAEFKHFH